MQIWLLALDGEVLTVGTFSGSGHELTYKSQKFIILVVVNS